MELPDLALLVEPFLSVLTRYWLAVVGAGVLAVFAAYHFNSPDYLLSKDAQADGEDAGSNPEKVALARTKIEAPPILTTRRERYRRSQVKYIAALETVFIFYVMFPELFSTMAEMWQVKIIVPEAERDRVIYGLFGLMGLYATFPGVNRFDKMIREKLHQQAIIPEDVKQTAARMFKADYKPPDGPDGIVSTALDGMHETLKQIDYEETNDPLKQGWIRLSCIHAQLKEMLLTDEFSRLHHFLSPEADDIGREYTQRQQQLVELIAKEAQIKPSRGKQMKEGKEEEELAKLNTLEAEFLLGIRKSLRFKIEVLHYRICLLHSMMLFASEKTATNIQSRFRAIGYDVVVPPMPKMDWESIIKTLMTISVVVFVPSLAYYVVKERFDIVTPEGSGITVPESMDQTLFWSVNILVLHALCIFIAMWTKNWLAKERAKAEHRRRGRLRSKFVENFMVFGLCYGATYLLGVFLFYPDHEMRVFRVGIPWATVPAVTGYFVGFYMDRVMTGLEVVWWRKYFQGILMGLFAAVASFLFTPPTPIVEDIPAIIWLYVLYISGMQVLIGVGVGWIFPKSYRNRLKAADQSAEDEAAGAAAPLVAPA